MNVKSIIVGSLAFSLAIGGTLFNLFTEDVKSVYTPRNTNNNDIKGYAGQQAYIDMLRSDLNTGQIDVNMMDQVKLEIEARSKSKKNKALLGLNWTQMGPDNVGGRTRAVLVDKNNSNTVYAGSVAGGLFVSYDGTATWQPVQGHTGTLGENLIISCITQTSNGRIFFGTGSTFEGGTGPFLGNGVYEYVPSTGAVLSVITNGPGHNNNSGAQFTHINAIAAKGNRLYIGTTDGLFWADPDGNGVYPTTISGWFNPLLNQVSLPETGTVHDIDIASDGSLIVVAFSGKHYISANGNDGLGDFTLTLASGGRLSCAVAPSNSNVIYRLRSSGILISLDISIDRGQNWSVIVPGGGSNNYCLDPFRQNDCSPSGQGGYDDCIAVDPGNWGHILVGGVQLFEWVYNPGSNPIGGSWYKSANLFESSSNPYYVHADKHTIVWPTSNTVYIGSDGGVFKSTDNGATWQERNYGYNVTTFYDIGINSIGWLIGGSQDNGCQMFAPGIFPQPTPLGTFEVTGGDGCYSFFFDQGPGMVFTSSQEGVFYRSAGGTPGQYLPSYIDASNRFVSVQHGWESFNDPLSVDSITILFDTNASNGVVYVNPANLAKPRFSIYNPGDTLMPNDTVLFESLSNASILTHVFPGPMKILSNPDSILVQDYLQAKVVVQANDGIWMSRDAARLNDLSPEWFKISNITSAYNFEFSADGNHLFVGTSSGVVRISGLSMANDSSLIYNHVPTVITSTTFSGLTGGGVYNVAVDPNDANNLIMVKSGYTSGNHVYKSTNALSASPTTTAIQGIGAIALPAMPVYDAVIDVNDNDRVIVGTDWGVWSIDNAFSGTTATYEWSDESGNGMAHCPVYNVEQQWWRGVPNTGFIYLGTYGRGFYATGDLATGVDEPTEFLDNNDNGFVSNLLVYPNPVNNSGTISFDLNSSTKATVNIYSLTGKLVNTMNLGSKNEGNHKVKFDASNLGVGTYIISLVTDQETSVAKFIVSR